MKVQNIRQTDTKKLIEEAMIDLLKRKQLDQITIKDLTLSANINRATFYAHYDDKYLLFNHMMEQSIENTFCTKHLIHFDSDTDLIETLLHSVESYLQEIKAHCPYSYTELFPKIRNIMVAKLTDILKKYVPNQRDETNFLFWCDLATRMIYDAAELYVLGKTALELKEVSQQINKLIDLDLFLIKKS